jgi:hypothetical protein
MHRESLYAERALRDGALGYVNKDQATDRELEVFRLIGQGVKTAARLHLSEDALYD